ncbi:MAG: IgGFc-binding protein, partial [Tannerella sp.]|nr:IgGFc-binding protein [Tannerella sp.]
MQRKKWFFMLCTCLLSLTAAAQDTEFWFVAPDVLHTHADRPVMFVFSNPDTTKSVEVSINFYSGNASDTRGDTTVTVSKGGAYTLDCGKAPTVDQTSKYTPASPYTPNRPMTLIENPISLYGSVSDYGIHITATGKIIAYYMVAADNQRDIFTLKGRQALGTDFYTPFQGKPQSYPQGGTGFSSNYQDAYSQIDIVATEPDTWVKITMPDGTESWVNLPAKGKTYKVYAKSMAGVNVVSGGAHPLSGTRIESVEGDNSDVHDPAKPIAVTITEDCISNRQAV